MGHRQSARDFVESLQWNGDFKKVLGHTERGLVSELRDVPNKWAHQRTFTTDDAYRALDSVEAFAQPPYRHLKKRKKSHAIRRNYPGSSSTNRHGMSDAKVAATMLAGQTVAGLRVRGGEVVTPHPDVASGRWQAEFAADLCRFTRGVHLRIR